MAVRLNYNTAAMRVCVDQAENGQIRGRVVSQRLRAPMAFSDVNNLMIQIDALLDIQKYPQAFQRSRSFSAGAPLPEIPAAGSKEEMMDGETVAAAQGELTTFLLHVSSRQNSSWQGFVDWLDGSPQQAFSSSLEFLRAVDGRLFRQTEKDIPLFFPV